nr:MAG TPA: rbx1 RING-H2 zinc finger domain [Caudoviricetes sp.]
MIIPLNAEYRSLRYQYTTRCAICQEEILKKFRLSRNDLKMRRISRIVISGGE